MSEQDTIECTVEGGPLDGRTLRVTAATRYVVVPVREKPAHVQYFAPDEPLPLEVDPWGQLRMTRPPLAHFEYMRFGNVLRPSGRFPDVP